MKLLTATKLTQGQRKNDFSFVPQGEIVTFSSECDREAIDGKCGCKRSMVGLESLKSTTTVQVVDLPLTQEQLSNALQKSLQKSGWARIMNQTDIDDLIKQDLTALLEVSNAFTVGTVLERRGLKFQIRSKN